MQEDLAVEVVDDSVLLAALVSQARDLQVVELELAALLPIVRAVVVVVLAGLAESVLLAGLAQTLAGLAGLA
jgi:hypothetical protein